MERTNSTYSACGRLAPEPRRSALVRRLCAVTGLLVGRWLRAVLARLARGAGVGHPVAAGSMTGAVAVGFVTAPMMICRIPPMMRNNPAKASR